MASAIELASFKAQNIPGDVRFLLDSNLKLANWKVPTDVGNECQGKLDSIAVSVFAVILVEFDKY